MRDRQLARATIEITLAIAVWVVGAQWILPALGAPGWVTDAATFAGAAAVALAVGWWRIGRFGPPAAGEPASPRAALDTGLLLSAGGGLVMCVLLLAQGADDSAAIPWGVAFGGLAVVQLVRLAARRRR